MSFSRGRRLLLYLTNHIIASIPSHGIRRWWYRRFIEVGENSTILMRLQLRDLRNIRIGHHSNINQRCVLDSRDASLEIGDYVDIAPEVMIWTLEHDPNHPEFGTKGGPVAIGDYAWIASRAIVLPGVTIGEGAVVAAGAVVVKDVEPYDIVAGVPARKVGERSRDQRPRCPYSPFLM